MNAYADLYGEANERQLSIIGLDNDESKIKKINNCPSEFQEQCKLVVWLRKKRIVHHHSPNGMKSSYHEGAKFKRLGTMPGFPDIIIPYARKGYHGLYIELKRVSGGVLSESQKWWRDFLAKEGYAWHEAKGCSQAKQIICDYFGLQAGE